MAIRENVACCMRGIPAWCFAARREERHVESGKKKTIIEEPLENVITTQTLQWMNWQTPTKEGGVSWFGSSGRYEPQTRRNLHAPCIPAFPCLFYTQYGSLFSFQTRPPFPAMPCHLAITLLYFLPPTSFTHFLLFVTQNTKYNGGKYVYIHSTLLVLLLCSLAFLNCIFVFLFLEFWTYVSCKLLLIF